MNIDVCLPLYFFFYTDISLWCTPKILIKVNSFDALCVRTQCELMVLRLLSFFAHHFYLTLFEPPQQSQSHSFLQFLFHWIRCGVFVISGVLVSTVFIKIKHIKNSNFFGNGESTFTHSHAYQSRSVRGCVCVCVMKINQRLFPNEKRLQHSSSGANGILEEWQPRETGSSESFILATSIAFSRPFFLVSFTSTSVF